MRGAGVVEWQGRVWVVRVLGDERVLPAAAAAAAAAAVVSTNGD